MRTIYYFHQIFPIIPVGIGANILSVCYIEAFVAVRVLTASISSIDSRHKDFCRSFFHRNF